MISLICQSYRDIHGCCCFFYFEREVCHRDCLILSFLLNVDHLAALIRQNQSIKGIKNEGQHKVSLYADDLFTYQ